MIYIKKNKQLFKYLIIVFISIVIFSLLFSYLSYINIIDNEITKIILHIILFLLIGIFSYKFTNRNKKYLSAVKFVLPIIIYNSIIYIIFIRDNHFKFLLFNLLIFLIVILIAMLNIRKKDRKN